MKKVGVMKWISDITLLWHPEALEMVAEAGRTELSQYEGYRLDSVITKMERDIAARGYHVSVTAQVDDYHMDSNGVVPNH